MWPASRSASPSDTCSFWSASSPGRSSAVSLYTSPSPSPSPPRTRRLRRRRSVSRGRRQSTRTQRRPSSVPAAVRRQYVGILDSTTDDGEDEELKQAVVHARHNRFVRHRFGALHELRRQQLLARASTAAVASGRPVPPDSPPETPSTTSPPLLSQFVDRVVQHVLASPAQDSPDARFVPDPTFSPDVAAARTRRPSWQPASAAASKAATAMLPRRGSMAARLDDAKERYASAASTWSHLRARQPPRKHESRRARKPAAKTATLTVPPSPQPWPQSRRVRGHGHGHGHGAARSLRGQRSSHPSAELVQAEAHRLRRFHRDEHPAASPMDAAWSQNTAPRPASTYAAPHVRLPPRHPSQRRSTVRPSRPPAEAQVLRHHEEAVPPPARTQWHSSSH